MAQVIRRHWRLALLQLFLIAGAVGLLIQHVLKSPSPVMAAVNAASGQTLAGTPANSLDPLLWSRIRRLRQKMALTNEDLAAAGCSQAQATGVLQSLLTWYPTHVGTWDQLEQAQIGAQRQVDEGVRQVNIGPKDVVILANLTSSQQALATASSQLDQFMQTAVTTATSNLANSQQQVLSAAKANAGLGLPSPYQFVSGVTSQQAVGIATAISRGQSAETVLPAAATALDAASTNVKQNMPAVLAAEALILPTPPRVVPVDLSGMSPASGAVGP